MLKRILFFDHTAKLGGGEIALLNLLQRLDKERYLPIAVLASDGPLREELDAAGIETHVVPLSSSVIDARKDKLGIGSLSRFRAAFLALCYCFRLARFIRNARVELVHTNSLKADVLGGIAARLAGVKSLWHVRDRIEDDYLPKPVVWLFRRLCRFIPNVIVANSHSTLKTLELTERQVFASVVHDGIPVESKVEPPKSRTGPPLIVLVGRITPWKGQHIFIEAAAKVRARFPSARFQIIGSAMFGEEEYEKKIRALVADLGLSHCMEFTGFREDVAELIKAADILVHASTSGEPFGQVVVEGMAAGKPVVATNGGGIPEIVLDGETGILVPMGDANAMSDALLRLLSEPAKAAALGNAGRERVLNQFTASHTAQNVEAVYRRIFAEPAVAAAVAELTEPNPISLKHQETTAAQ